MPMMILCFILSITLAHGAQIVKRQSPGLSPRGLPMASALLEDPFEPAELSDRVMPPAFFNPSLSNQLNGFFQNPFSRMPQQGNFRANAGGLYSNNNLQPAVPGMFNQGLIGPGEIRVGQRAQFPQNLAPPAANGVSADLQFMYDMYNTWQNRQGEGSLGNLPRSTGLQTQSGGQNLPFVPRIPQQPSRNPPPVPGGSPQLKRLQLMQAIAEMNSARGSNQPLQRNQARFQTVPSDPQPALPGPSYNLAGENLQNGARFDPTRQSSLPVGMRELLMGLGTSRTGVISEPVQASPPVVADTTPPALLNLLQTLRNQPSNRIIPQNVLSKLLADSVKSNGIRQMLSAIRGNRPSNQGNAPSRQTNDPLQNNRRTSQSQGLTRQIPTRGLPTNNVTPQTQVGFQTGQAGFETVNPYRQTQTGFETVPPTRLNPYPTMIDGGQMRYDVQLSSPNSANPQFRQANPQYSPGPAVSMANGGWGQSRPINAPVDSPQLTTVPLNTPDPRKSSVLVIPGEKIGTVAAPL